MLIDDLEFSRREARREIFDRYGAVLDAILVDKRHRASVHFLVNMIEAYYFGDPDAINEALSIQLGVHDGDVEEIRHPKGRLKELSPGFDEIRHGRMIVENIDLERVLDDPATCASLRALVKWCSAAIGDEHSDRFRLKDGVCCPVTGQQRPHPDARS